MDKAISGKAKNYALIILGVGFGQSLSGYFSGKTLCETGLAMSAFFLVSLLVFAATYLFLSWWGIKQKSLGKSDPLPLLLSPIVWLPALALLVYLATSISNA